jgi:hypothetical protein
VGYEVVKEVDGSETLVSWKKYVMTERVDSVVDLQSMPSELHPLDAASDA